MTWLSPEAEKAKEDAAIRRRIRAGVAERRRHKMQLGPRLEGRWLVIPSKVGYYREEAVQFWRSLPGQWADWRKVWIINTEQSYEGKRYSRWAWLRGARRKFYEFYPELEDAEGSPKREIR